MCIDFPDLFHHLHGLHCISLIKYSFVVSWTFILTCTAPGSLHFTPVLGWVSALNVCPFCSPPNFSPSLDNSHVSFERPPPILNSSVLHSVNFFSLSAKCALFPTCPESSLVSPRKSWPLETTPTQHSKLTFLCEFSFVCLLCFLTFEVSLGCGTGRHISSAIGRAWEHYFRAFIVYTLQALSEDYS